MFFLNLFKFLRFDRINLLLGTVIFLVSCTSHIQHAPVVNRSSFLGKVGENFSPLHSESVPPGMVRVEEGDSLYQIALKTGRNWRDLAKWNNLSNPDYIEFGQLLHTAPPNSFADKEMDSENVVLVSDQKTVEVEQKQDNFISVDIAKKNSLTKMPPMLKNSNSFSVAGFIWPAKGIVKKAAKGVDILGQEGADILAAAEGRVLYAGTGLRSYGNLIVLRHSSSWLTAYGHNRILLVKEGDEVSRGQKIAEMGNSGSNDRKMKLYFEVRKISDEKDSEGKDHKKGVVIDPLSILPVVH